MIKIIRSIIKEQLEKCQFADLNNYDQDAIVVQTKLDSYMLIDKETYNRWYDEEFTKEEIIGELIKRGWRIKK